MKIKSLHIYPVKGLRGVDLSECKVEARGLVGDRRWMVVDDNGKFITQRENAGMARIGAEIIADGLRLSDGDSHVEVETPTAASPRLLSTVWKSEVNAYLAEASAAQWLSQRIGTTCKLVWQGDAPRAVSPIFGRPGDQVSFADGFPLLITTTASLWDLNGKMQKPLPMDRFRANIVIDTQEPWAEDGWQNLNIGGLDIEIVKPCTRCVVTTTDQQSGMRDGAEPIATLREQRLLRSPEVTGVIFGQNAIARSYGLMKVGDHVEVAARQQPPAYVPMPAKRAPAG